MMMVLRMDNKYNNNKYSENKHDLWYCCEYKLNVNNNCIIDWEEDVQVFI